MDWRMVKVYLPTTWVVWVEHSVGCVVCVCLCDVRSIVFESDDFWPTWRAGSSWHRQKFKFTGWKCSWSGRLKAFVVLTATEWSIDSLFWWIIVRYCRLSGFYRAMHYSAKRGLEIACRLSICLSLTLVHHDHIGWKSWKLIARTISPSSLLFVAQRSCTYTPREMEKFWGENVRSTPTSITSGWIESTESRVIVGRGVAVCLLLSAHRAVIFAIAQLS